MLTWYDADLGKDGVRKLNKLFREEPFFVTVNKERRYYSANCNFEENDISFRGYDTGKIVIYHGAVKRLNKEKQQQIMSKLSIVDPLVRLMKNIELTQIVINAGKAWETEL